MIALVSVLLDDGRTDLFVSDVDCLSLQLGWLSQATFGLLCLAQQPVFVARSLFFLPQWCFFTFDRVAKPLPQRLWMKGPPLD